MTIYFKQEVQTKNWLFTKKVDVYLNRLKKVDTNTIMHINIKLSKYIFYGELYDWLLILKEFDGLTGEWFVLFYF